MFLLRQPEICEAQVFSQMPAKFRHNSDGNEWVAANQRRRGTGSFLEGPVFDDRGNLYVTDIPHGRIFRIDTKGEWELVCQYDGEPNGMKFLEPGVLLIADYKNGLMKLDLTRGSVESWFTRRSAERFKGVNDLTLDSHGNVYFTDQGQTGLHDPTGRVFRLAPSGKLDALISNVPSPNGLVLSPNEEVLFVAVTRANAVWRVPLQETGEVSKVGQFFTTYGPAGPDGLAVDRFGHLFVANPGLGYLWILNNKAEPEAIIKSAAGDMITNLCFSTIEQDAVYMTESHSGSILKYSLQNLDWYKRLAS